MEGDASNDIHSANMELLNVPIRRIDNSEKIVAISVIKKSLPVTAKCEQYRYLVEKYDWNVDKMMAIMKKESHCIPNNVNDNPQTGDYSIGLLQVNLYGNLAKNRPSESYLKVPSQNIAYAYILFKEGGYGQWSTAKEV